MLRKVLFMWLSIPIFSFIRDTLTELFRKPDNWRQIYKQTSSTFYTSIDVSRRKNNLYVITSLPNSCLIAIANFKKYRSSRWRCRSSHQRYSVKKMFLKISNFTEYTCDGVFFNRVAGLPNFLKKRLQHKCFPVKYVKLLRTPILKNICKRLLLEVF